MFYFRALLFCLLAFVFDSSLGFPAETEMIEGPKAPEDPYSVTSSSDGAVTFLTVTGPGGIHDVIRLPSTTPLGISITNNRLTVGNAIFSRSGQLVLVTDGTCVERTYPPGGPVAQRVLSAAECSLVLREIQQVGREADEMEESLSRLGDDISQSVAQSMASSFGRNCPFGDDNPFGNNWPFGPVNNPFAQGE